MGDGWYQSKVTASWMLAVSVGIERIAGQEYAPFPVWNGIDVILRLINPGLATLLRYLR